MYGRSRSTEGSTVHGRVGIGRTWSVLVHPTRIVPFICGGNEWGKKAYKAIG